MIEITKISSKGQITIPIEIRKKLNLVSGSKLAFIEDEDGKFYVVNSSMLVLKKAQESFSKIQDEYNIKNEDELISIIKKNREE